MYSRKVIGLRMEPGELHDIQHFCKDFLSTTIKLSFNEYKMKKQGQKVANKFQDT